MSDRTPIHELPYSAGLMSQSCGFVESRKLDQMRSEGMDEQAFHKECQAGMASTADIATPRLSEPMVTCDPSIPMDGKQLEFAVFCVENVAKDLEMDSIEVYDLLTRNSDILYGYILPSYDALHTQGKEYICEDIEGIMRERGLLS